MGVYSLSKSGINNWSKYSNVAGANGQTSDFELIGSQFLTSAVSAVTFANLQNYSQYKHLQVRLTARSSNAAATDTIFIQINGDYGSNYSDHVLRGYGGSVTSSAWTSQGWLALPSQTVGANAATYNFSAATVDFLDAFSASKNKTMRALSGFNDPAYAVVGLSSGAWLSTSAITSLTFNIQGSTFTVGSRFSLYGVK